MTCKPKVRRSLITPGMCPMLQSYALGLWQSWHISARAAAMPPQCLAQSLRTCDFSLCVNLLSSGLDVSEGHCLVGAAA